MTRLTVTIDRRADSTIIGVCGEVDATSRAQLTAALEEGRRLGVPIIMDLSAMTFLDSSGLNLLLRAHNQAATKGRQFHLAALHPRPHRLLEIVGLLPLLQPHATVEQALRAAAPESETPIES
ncbi:STAS domain-containing protein [Nonomuraea lactucae]|uniref:STAS domain-containing protein n=1 Tax=Nonomuraea lactucae TaxID=2249762 RepID=UPI000DE44E10|nr:STAS domain-containing protein [Nonomuraea lactucae]